MAECSAQDTHSGEEQRGTAMCNPPECLLVITDLIPNHSYEVRCGMPDNMKLTAPRLVFTRPPPVEFVNVTMLPNNSVRVQLRPKVSTQVLCSAIAEKTYLPVLPPGAPIKVKLPPDELTVDMMVRSSVQQSRWCEATEDAGPGCTLFMDNLFPASAYSVACLPEGGHQGDIVPSTFGFSLITPLAWPSPARAAEWKLVLFTGLYLLLGSVFFAVVIGALHWEENCDFSRYQGSMSALTHEALNRHNARHAWWPKKFGHSTLSLVCFELLRTVGLCHLFGFVLFYSVALPVYASFAYTRDWGL
jgi:hypothetical protein